MIHVTEHFDVLQHGSMQHQNRLSIHLNPEHSRTTHSERVTHLNIEKVRQRSRTHFNESGVRTRFDCRNWKISNRIDLLKRTMIFNSDLTLVDNSAFSPTHYHAPTHASPRFRFSSPRYLQDQIPIHMARRVVVDCPRPQVNHCVHIHFLWTLANGVVDKKKC